MLYASTPSRPDSMVRVRYHIYLSGKIWCYTFNKDQHEIIINMTSYKTYFLSFKFLPNKDKFRIYLFVSKMKICIS